MWFLAATLLSLVAVGFCGNYSVTDEAWFEVEVKGMDGPGIDYIGKFTVALFGKVAPMTVLNFKSLAKGYKRKGLTLHYKGSPVHSIVTDFLIQMGDVVNRDGSSGRSIYGEKFVDEEFILSHRSPGWVSMANHGKDTNGSQFFILLTKARWLDGKHVVFGKVINGFDTVETIGSVPVDANTALPKMRVLITDCGVNEVTKPYDLTKADLDSTKDL